MKKKLLAVLMSLCIAGAMTSCGGAGGSTGTSSKENSSSVSVASESSAAASSTAAVSTEAPAEAPTYQSILDEYTQKITDATPGLVEEYNSEAAEKAGDVTALAEISNAKITKLAEICTEGIEKMAEIKLLNGDDDTTYNEWAAKLQEVYTAQSKQITDAYMSSAS